MALTSAGVALLTSLVLARIQAPPGFFAKYIDAALHPPTDPSRLLDFSPLYLLLAQLVIPRGGPVAMLYLQAGLHALAAAAACLAVARLTSPRWGLLAGLMVATLRSMVDYVGTLEPELVILAALAGAIWAAGVAREGLRAPAGTEGPSGGAALRWCALSGALLGTAGILRPQYVGLLLPWALWLALGAPRRRRVVAAVVCAGGAAVVLPMVLARLAQTGQATVMSPGTVFYEGNSPGVSGFSSDAPELVRALEFASPERSADGAHIAYRRIAAAVLHRPVSSPDSTRYWTGLAWEWIRASPQREAGLLLQKLTLALGPYEFHDLPATHQLDVRLRPTLFWGFGLLLCALPLLAFLGRSLAEALLGPLLLALTSLGVQVIFYASARQRLPLSLALCVCLPAALSRLAAVRPARLLAAGLLGAILWLATSRGTAELVAMREVSMQDFVGQAAPTERGLAALWDGRWFEAEPAQAKRALLRGEEAYVHQRLDEARRTLEPVFLDNAESFPRISADAGYYLARAELGLGHPARAREIAEHALELVPDHVRLGALVLSLQDHPPALPQLEAWRPPGVDPLSARVALARELAFAGRDDLSEQLTAPVFRDLPELAQLKMP